MRNNRLSIVALVVSFVALAFSLSMNASAFPGMNQVDSGDIVNDTVRGIDIKESSLGTVPVANSLRLSSLATPSLGSSPAAEAIRRAATSVKVSTSFAP